VTAKKPNVSGPKYLGVLATEIYRSQGTRDRKLAANG